MRLATYSLRIDARVLWQPQHWAARSCGDSRAEGVDSRIAVNCVFGVYYGTCLQSSFLPERRRQKDKDETCPSPLSLKANNRLA